MWGKVKTVIWQCRVPLISAPLATVIVIAMRWACLLQLSELAMFDRYTRWQPVEPSDRRISLVTISEADLQECCFIPSGDVAKLLTKLEMLHPRVIGVSIPNHLLGEKGRQDLNKLITSNHNFIFANQPFSAESHRGSKVLSSQASTANMEANITLLDPDSRIRRSMIAFTTSNGETVFNLSFYLAKMYLGKERIALQRNAQGILQLGKAKLIPFTGNGGGYVDIETTGYQVVMNYRNFDHQFETVSMTEVLQNRLPKDWGRDRIILVGIIGDNLQSPVLTPFSGGLHFRPKTFPPIEVQANFTSQLLSAAQGQRPMIDTWTPAWENLWILAWASLAATLSWRVRFIQGMKIFIAIRLGLILPTITALFLITYVAFLYGWWIPVIPPLIAAALAASGVIIYIAQTASVVRNTFGRYLTDEIVATILESPTGLKLGGERRQITILTSDLRGFTAISEALPAEEVVRILNLYLEQMADIITRYGGVIDEFMGDGILVLFGATVAKPDDAIRAIACAVAMQLAMDSVNHKMTELELPQLAMGIGINTGEVVIGNIGSEKRTKYGVVGSQVNLTYRIESYTVGGQVFISESTLKAAEEEIVEIKSSKQVQPKGVASPLTIYEVAGIGGKYNFYLKESERLFLPLSPPLPIQFVILEDKHISDRIYQAEIIKLCPQAAEIQCKSGEDSLLPSPSTNLKLNLLDASPEITNADIYGKVLDQETGDCSFYLIFTAQPHSIREKLTAIYQELCEQAVSKPN